MGLVEYKNNIKTLFLIFNTTCGIIGSYAVSTGAAMAILFDMRFASGMITVVSVVGTLAVALAVLGCIAAVMDNKIMLIIYSAAMTVLKGVFVAMATVDYVGILQQNENSEIRHTLVRPVAFLLCNVFITLITVALAVTVAALAGRQARAKHQGTELAPIQHDEAK